MVPWLLAAALLVPPLISGEVEVTTPVLQQSANATHPAVATDGTEFLVVWKTTSDGPFSLTASRITSDGTRLDPLGFRVGGPTHDAAWMAPHEVHFTAGRYLVTHPSPQALDVVAVERDGTIAARRTVFAMTGIAHRAASNGERMLVAADDGRGAIVDRNANVIAQIQLAGPRIQAVASDGSDFLVLSGAQCAGNPCPQTIFGERFSSDGHRQSSAVVLSLANVPAALGFDHVAMTRAASHYVLFARLRVPQPDAVFAGSLVAFLLDDDGHPVGEPVTLQENARIPERMRALHDSRGDAVLLFEESDRTTVWHFDPGTRTAASQVLHGEPQAAVAYAASSTLLVTADHAGRNARLTARLVDASLQQTIGGNAIPLSLTAPPQDVPLVHANGNAVLVAWREQSGRDVSTRGALFDAQGRRVTEPFGPLLPTQSIASDGTDFLLALGYGPVRVQRVSGSGATLDAEPRVVGAYSSSPAPVWNGTHYLVFTSAEMMTYGAYGHVDAIVLARAGDVVRRVELSSRDNTHAQQNVVAASNGEETLVVWRDQVNPPGCTKFCTPIVHFDGAVLDRDGNVIATPRFAAVDASAYPASLAFGGGEYLLTWWQGAWPTREARAMRIARDGRVIEDASLDPRVTSAPVASWNGQTFDLAWLRGEDLVFRRGEHEVIVDADQAPALASIPNVATVIAYARHVDDAVHGSTSRVFVRVAPVTSGPRRRSVR